MTDGSGTWVWDVAYAPFGATTYLYTNPEVMNGRFPGQWFQLETGLAYNWHRHYDPTTGRYIQPDPLTVDDGNAAVAGLAQDILPGGASDGHAVAKSMGWQEAHDIIMGRLSSRVMLQNGPSIYGYAGQSSLTKMDVNGEQAFIVGGAEVGGAVGGPPGALIGSAIGAGVTVGLLICERRTSSSPGGGAGRPLDRCLRAADGPPGDWGAFCGSIPPGERNNVVGEGSAKNACIGKENLSATEKKNWCQNQYGNH